MAVVRALVALVLVTGLYVVVAAGLLLAAQHTGTEGRMTVILAVAGVLLIAWQVAMVRAALREPNGSVG